MSREGIHRFLILGSYAIKGGKISMFGTIHILDRSVDPEPMDERAGLEVWSQALYEHRNGNFKAVCTDENLEIINEEGTVVATILPGEVFSVNLKYWSRVHENGWTLTIWDDEKEEWNSSTLKAILATERGEIPGKMDNSPFVKVSQELIGSRVMTINIGDGVEDAYKIFNEKGELIEHQMLYPISFKKWAPDDTATK